MTSKFLKNTATSVATVFIATSAFALDVGVGIGVGSVGVGAGASVGHGSVAGAGVGASVGGVGAGAGASVGGGSTGGGSTGNDSGTTGSVTGTATASGSNNLGRSSNAPSASAVSIQAALGATVMTADRQVVGMIEDVRPSSQGKFVATVRMNAAFGATPRTIQINMQMPKKETNRIRIGLTKSNLLRQIQG